MSRLERRLGRMRQTGSLGLRRRAALRGLIASTQRGLLGPFVTPQTFELAGNDESGEFASGQREYDDGARFFGHFEGTLAPGSLAGKDVFDLGCGYGGRTVYYAELGPASITGIEISERMIERCRGFAEHRDQESIDFRVAFAEDLPFADDSFDTVLCYDVFEHLHDPVRAFRELGRVLRPDGDAWLVFPTYLGARSSHLDYLTQIPGLHRVFDPDLIVETVNEFLTEDPDRYGVVPQPRPVVGPLGRRALPSVNGMDRREAIALIEHSRLRIEEAAVRPLIGPSAPPIFALASRALERLSRVTGEPDLLVGGLAFHLKPDR